MVFIHQAFKDELKNVRPDLQTKFWLTDINNKPNVDIMTSLMKIFWRNTNEPTTLAWYRIVNDSGSWSSYDTVLELIMSIDDAFYWTESGLRRWWGIAEIINTLEEQRQEAELFKIGKIVRVCAADKLRGLNLLNLRDHIGRHYKVLTYKITDHPWAANAFAAYTWGRSFKKVLCEDWVWNLLIMPQAILVPTSIKDLRVHEEGVQLEKIIYRLQDTQKFELERLTSEYSDKLSIFMESSKLLHEKMSPDFTEEAKRILDAELHLKDNLMKNKQVANIIYVMDEQLTVETVPLFCWEPDGAKFPIGRFRMVVKLSAWDLRITNLDIGNEGTYQHPHIQSRWQCCLWEFVNPLRTSYNKRDYVTLIGWLIWYLETLNPRSVFVSMERFQESNYDKFKYSVSEEKQKKTKSKPASGPIIVMDEAANIDDSAVIQWTPVTEEFVTPSDFETIRNQIWAAAAGLTPTAFEQVVSLEEQYIRNRVIAEAELRQAALEWQAESIVEHIPF